MNDYKPISCSFHDYIEHFITLRKNVDVVFYKNGIETKRTSRILETYTSPTKEEFMKLEFYQEEIRLDDIISIDKYSLNEFD